MKGFLNPFLALRNEIVIRYLDPFGLQATSWVVKAKLPIPIIYLSGAIAALCTPVRRLPYAKPFLKMLGICFFILLFFDNQRNGTYLAHIFPLYAIVLACLVTWLWQTQTAWRPVMAVFVVGFLLLQAGGSLYLIATNPYRRDYQPIVEFVRQHSKPGDRIVGTSELGFGIGFDTLHDDEALGYYVNRMPDVIVMSPRYQAWYDSLRTKNTGLYEFITQRLKNNFSPAFQTRAFSVYLRNQDSLRSRE